MPRKKAVLTSKVNEGASTSQQTIPQPRTNTLEPIVPVFTPVSGPHPAFSSLNWIPVQKSLPSSATNTVTISLPFRGLSESDIPEVLQCFGGAQKVANTLKNPRDTRKLVFDFYQDTPLSHPLGRPITLSRSQTNNDTFVLELQLEDTPETPAEQTTRSKKELSAVDRALGAKVSALPPKLTGAVLTHRIQTLCEFDQLYDYHMCPAVPKDRTSAAPKNIQLTSVVSSILPSFPMSEENNVDLFFPCAKFTNQVAFRAVDYIPSIYTEPLAAQEKLVLRARRAYGLSVKWPEKAGQIPTIPKEATIGALKNLRERVSQDITAAAEQLLAEVPIWTRRRFYQKLAEIKPTLLAEHKRFVLPGLAFRFTNGPWTRAWCAYGYNPCEKPESRRYQMIDYRINQGIVQKKRTVTKKHQPTAVGTVLQKLVEKLDNPENLRGFQFMIQLKDLEEVAPIREILNSPDNVKDYCDARDGFFKTDTVALIRLEITKAIEREDPGLAGLDDVMRGMKQLGLFKNVVVAQRTAGDSDEEPEDQDMMDASGAADVSM